MQPVTLQAQQPQAGQLQQRSRVEVTEEVVVQVQAQQGGQAGEGGGGDLLQLVVAQLQHLGDQEA